MIRPALLPLLFATVLAHAAEQTDREFELTGRLDRRTAAALGVSLNPPAPAAAGAGLTRRPS
jgi:hypothetical protein